MGASACGSRQGLARFGFGKHASADWRAANLTRGLREPSWAELQPEAHTHTHTPLEESACTIFRNHGMHQRLSKSKARLARRQKTCVNTLKTEGVISRVGPPPLLQQPPFVFVPFQAGLSGLAVLSELSFCPTLALSHQQNSNSCVAPKLGCPETVTNF